MKSTVLKKDEKISEEAEESKHDLKVILLMYIPLQGCKYSTVYVNQYFSTIHQNNCKTSLELKTSNFSNLDNELILSQPRKSLTLI